MSSRSDLYITTYEYSVSECLKLYNGVLKKGFFVAYDYLLNFFPTLYAIYEISD